MDVTKVCTKCDKEYPATPGYFCKDRHKRDGLRSWCKECVAVPKRKYNQSPTAKKAQRKYNQTPARKEARRKYNNTPAGRLRNVFSDMNQRCNNPNHPSYKNYGGRGIKNKFESLDDFRNYVINELLIDPRGLQIDRIDNGGNYEKGNIRFVTHAENQRNKGRQ